jgi:Fe-S-cluster containining protein
LDAKGDAPDTRRRNPQGLIVDLQTPFGRLRGNLALPDEPMRLAEIAWNAMTLDDGLIGLAVASEERLGRKVSCRKGCSACCRHAVPLSPPEAWLLRDLVVSFAPEQKGKILERFANIKDRLDQEGFGRRSLPHSASMDEVQALGLDYFRLGLACPFLDEDTCLIYPQRPYSCRTHLVTSPAEYCSEPDLYAVKPVQMAISLTEILSKLAARLMGGDPFVIPMVLALDWAEEHKEEGRQRYDPAPLITLLVEMMNGSPSGAR